MTYASPDDMIGHFGETEMILLSNDDPNAVTVGAGNVTIALERAEKTINGYIAGRYPLPLADVPAQLVDIECDLARYNLATRSGNSRPTDDMRTNRNDAMKLLGDIASGKFSLGLDAGGVKVAAGALTKSVPPDNSFTKDSLCDFMPLNGHRRRWPR